MRELTRANPPSPRAAMAGRNAESKTALLTYYAREGLFQHLASECSKQLERRGADGTLMWWRATAVGLGGDAATAVRELEELRAKRDLQLPVQTALLHFHRRASRIDHEEVDALEASLPTARDLAADPAVMLAALFHWFVGLHTPTVADADGMGAGAGDQVCSLLTAKQHLAGLPLRDSRCGTLAAGLPRSSSPTVLPPCCLPSSGVG